MNNSLIIREKTNGITQQVGELVEFISNNDNIDTINEYHKKVKATREYYTVLGEIEKIRVDLLKIEVACIIRMYGLGNKIKGMPDMMHKFFYDNGYDINYYLEQYPNCITARQIYNKYKEEVDKQEAYRNGLSTALGIQSQRSEYTEEEMKKEAKTRYYDIQSAMKVLIDDLSTQDKPFTIDEMSKKIPDTIPESYEEGVKEVCRKAVREAKIDTIGEKQAPRFVTYMDENVGKKWLRIPFENANIDQLEQMIALRQEQLSQDAKSLKRLKKILSDLKNIAGEKHKEYLIKDIVRLNVT